MKRAISFALTGVAAAIGATVFSPNVASAEPRQYEERYLGEELTTVNEYDSPVPLLKGHKMVRVWSEVDPGVTVPAGAIAPAANTNIIYLNNCDTALGNNCAVTRAGSTDSTTNRSHIIGKSGTLPKLSVSANTWASVVQCMRQVYGPFNVVITDQDPGTAPHFEIMFGGDANRDFAMGPGIGGVSPATCSSFIPNSLVFVFDVWGDNVEDLCSTAAQEIAHSFSLDHTTEASDPLTYFTSFPGRKFYKDGAENCGSDCINGSINGFQCSGPGQQTRNCFCGGSTQNPSAEIRALFGDGTPTPPVVTILNPKTGDIVMPGFPVAATVNDDQGVSKVELHVDGQLVQTLTSGPFAFNAPATLGDGTHTAEIIGYDVFGAQGSAQVQVIIGKPCGKPSDCPDDTQTCVGGRCVPGPGVQGGLGTACTNPQECASGQCAMSSDGAFCVEPCALGEGQCPSGFGCLDTGAGDGNGVCFPGVDEGGGCLSSGGSAGSIGFGLGFALLLVTRRRRR